MYVCHAAWNSSSSAWSESWSSGSASPSSRGSRRTRRPSASARPPSTSRRAWRGRRRRSARTWIAVAVVAAGEEVRLLEGRPHAARSRRAMRNSVSRVLMSWSAFSASASSRGHHDLVLGAEQRRVGNEREGRRVVLGVTALLVHRLEHVARVEGAFVRDVVLEGVEDREVDARALADAVVAVEERRRRGRRCRRGDRGRWSGSAYACKVELLLDALCSTPPSLRGAGAGCESTAGHGKRARAGSVPPMVASVSLMFAEVVLEVVQGVPLPASAGAPPPPPRRPPRRRSSPTRRTRQSPSPPRLPPRRRPTPRRARGTRPAGSGGSGRWCSVRFRVDDEDVLLERDAGEQMAGAACSPPSRAQLVGPRAPGPSP